ncbi:hypothetical protein EK21DRAFT_87233 [Setomelanomma holmii]|uniref:Uncharacterized protein n=1 Tax=Setomelanomma holmii TaxID=210430 RepID=A0A9P4LR25_9PLEO|nr:hypothetical protein EK21DRAFT_87233 [Setomelanomma holmii]
MPPANENMTDGANYKSRGYTATLPAYIQVRKTIDMMNTLKDGSNICAWSGTARRELFAGGDVDVVDDAGNIIGTSPKLALVVVSRMFREHFEAHPDAKQVKITSTTIDAQAVDVLLGWVKSILNGNGKWGVSVPASPLRLIKVRHAAYELSMHQYIRHFQRTYKDGLRDRTPNPEECGLMERCAIGPKDDMVTGLGERLAYLRRRGEFNAASIAALADFLKDHPMIKQAVMDADYRAANLISRRF